MSGGVKAALDAVMDGQGDMDQVVQSGLFDDLAESETGAIDAPSPLSGALSPRKSGPGRRKGSKNRRTEAVTAWLLQQHRHPVSVMMEAYTMSPADLAERIGLRKAMVRRKRGDEEYEEEGEHYSNADLMDLFKLQLRMAEAAAPYVAQKLPQAVQIDAKAGVTIGFEGVSFPARGAAGQAAEPIEGDVMAVRLPFKSDE